MGILAAVLSFLYPERGAQMTNAAAALLLLISGVVLPGGDPPLLAAGDREGVASDVRDRRDARLSVAR